MAIAAKEAKKMTTQELLKKKHELEFLVSRFNNIQLTQKVKSNAFYGAFANKFFRYFDVRIAGSITRSGQFITKSIGNRINDYLNRILQTEEEDYVVFSHTDSMYICLEGVVNKLFDDPENTDPLIIAARLEKICIKKIYPKINEIFEDIAGYVNAFENRMNMKIEAIADKGIWTGKNRYILRIYYDEGKFLRHPLIKKVGIETVRSNIPALCRQRISDAIDLILEGDVAKVRGFVADFESEYMELPMSDIAIPTGVNRLEHYSSKSSIYTSRTPNHVKGSLLYNHLLKKMKLEKQYQSIKEGDKIKFVKLQKPNPIHEVVIAYIDVLPSEFGLHEYIDRYSMFERCFLGPVRKVSDAVGWELKERVSINSIFGWAPIEKEKRVKKSSKRRSQIAREAV